MPTNDNIRHELAAILASSLGTDSARVLPGARLAELGVDSLATGTVADALGQRLGVRLDAETADSLVTVQDAVDAIAARTATSTADGPVPRDPHRTSAAWRLATWMVVAGAAIGLALGFGSAAIVSATGLGNVDLPPLAAPTATPTPTSTPKPTPSPTPTAEDAIPPPTLAAESDRVSPGQRFRLSGAFPELGDGAVLQVQVKDPGAEWDDFPITTTTRANGSYETVIYTSRTGKREFRMLHKESDTASPVITVQIG